MKLFAECIRLKKICIRQENELKEARSNEEERVRQIA